MKGFWVLQLPVANRQEKESATDRKFTPNRRGNEPQSKKHCTSFCTKDRSGRWQSKWTDLLSENSCQCHPIAIPRTISTNCRTFRCYGSNFSKMLLNKQRVHFRFPVFGSNHGGPSGTTKVIQIHIRIFKVWFYSMFKRLNCIELFITKHFHIKDKKQSWKSPEGQAFNLATHCIPSLTHLPSSEGPSASTHKLLTGDAPNVPSESRNHWWWTASSNLIQDWRAEPQTTHPQSNPDRINDLHQSNKTVPFAPQPVPDRNLKLCLSLSGHSVKARSSIHWAKPGF